MNEAYRELPIAIEDISKDSISKRFTPLYTNLPFLPTGIGHFKAQRNYYIERENFLNMQLIIWTGKGAGDFVYRNKKFSLLEGQAVLINMKEYHKWSISPDIGLWNFKWIRFSSPHFELYDSIINNGGIAPLPVAESEFDELHSQFLTHLESSEKFKDFMLSSLIQLFLTILCTAKSRRDLLSGNEKFKPLERCRKYISNNYSYPISIDDMAKQCCQSRSSFIRKFTHFMGISPYAYLQSIRISHSLELLELSEKSICDIALEVGFCDQNNFTKQFKLHTGTTPRKYRAQYSSKLNS